MKGPVDNKNVAKVRMARMLKKPNETWKRCYMERCSINRTWSGLSLKSPCPLQLSSPSKSAAVTEYLSVL